MNFTELHAQSHPLLICNVWDVPSARIAEQSGFQAIATSSSAVAHVLGYEDGEELPFSELLYLVKRIAANIQTPLSVDLEAGYSRDPLQIADHIRQLAELGVVGINFEDSLVEKGKGRSFVAAESFGNLLSTIKQELAKEQIEMFINVRTDAFILKHLNPVAESQHRIPIYEAAGADGIFVPCVEQEAHIQQLVSSTSLPVNVLNMPGLPDFTTLKSLGVKRISMGNSLFDNMYRHYAQSLATVVQDQSFSSIW